MDNATWLSFESKNAFLIIFSIITVAATFYLLYVAVDATLASNVLLIEKERDISDEGAEEAKTQETVKAVSKKKKSKKA